MRSDAVTRIGMVVIPGVSEIGAKATPEVASAPLILTNAPEDAVGVITIESVPAGKFTS